MERGVCSRTTLGESLCGSLFCYRLNQHLISVDLFTIKSMIELPIYIYK